MDRRLPPIGDRRSPATKILALTRALGDPARFRLMPGQRYDSVEVPPPIDGTAVDALIAGEAFHSNAKP